MNRRPTPFSLSRHLTHLLVCIYIFSPLAIPIVSLQAGDEIIDFDNRPFNEVTPYAPSNIRFDQKNRYLFHRDFGSYRFLQKDYRLFIDEAGSASSASLPDNGTDYARDLPTSTPITIVRIDGHPFELRSFDVAEYSSVIPQPVVVFITGVKSDHSEVTASFVSDGRFDGSGPMEDFETLMLPDGFVDLVRVDIETSGCHLDNFRLSGPDFLSRNTDYPARPIIFDLTWESDRFPENLPPETGGFDAPTLVFSLPLVLQSSSAFAGKSLFLQRGQHPAGWIAAENDDAEGFQIAHNANASSYHVAARLLIPHLSTSGEGEKLSISLTTSPYAVNLIFNSNGTISFSVNHHSDEETIGNFTFGKPLGIGIRVDRRSGMILIDKDGQTVHTESLGAPILDITETKVLLHSASGSSSSAEVADFRVTGNEIPLFYEARGPIPEVPVLQPSATPFLSADVGITVSRPIVIKNIGDEELRIDAIEFTSSSLQVKAELPLIISPGETGSITVSYTGEDPSLGRQYGDMYVYSNSDISPIRRSFEFLTRGHGRIAVLPQSVNRVMRANSQSVFTLGLAYYGINPSYSFNIQFPAEGQDLPVPTVPITPNDPLFSSQWHHRTPASGSAGIDTTRAWSVTRGSPLVVVAVVDTGVNFDHPDLQDARNHGNQGYDFLDDDNDPSDPSIDPFGTFVAGVIGATGNNGQGGAGVASNVKIMALRYIDADRGIGFASDAADCITYAANNGANVINNSWGSNNFSGAILLAIETALRKGITVVNSAGNRGLSNDVTPYYPASYVARSLAGTDDTIAVAASTENDNLDSNSSFGAVSVDVVAPGRNILGTWRNDTYDTDSGTGQSTAIVSGVAALLYSQDPLITPYDVKTAILSSVDKLASLEGRVASGGRVNAARALEQRAREWLSTPDGGASTLARGETAQAEFTIDTTGLAPGRYSKNIFFYETNTYGLSGEIPLTIDVIGDITDPPTILQQQSVAAEAETGKVTSLRIEALGEPIAYQWYRGSPGDTSHPVGQDSGTFVTEEHVFPGTETYWVRLTNANGYTDSSEYRINVVMAPPHAPRDLTATSGSFPDRVRISWSPVSGANSYDVYRSVDWTFAAASRIALDLSSTTFDDLDVDEGELFYYWVISKGAGGSSLPGGPNSGRISLETPASLSQLDASNGTERNSIRLNWDRASNAISYDVFRSASERFEEAVLLGSTHTTEWLDMEHAAPGSYFYWVRARNPDREGAPTVSALSETGHSTPDVWVISREGNLTGSGSHSAKDGISTAGIHSKSFSGVSYTTYVKNEGSMTDSYLISIRTSKTDLVTTHIDRSTGFNISAALITGTWKSDSVSPGEMRAILSTTKPSGRLARSKRRSFNSLGMVTGQAELSFPAPDSVGLRFSFVRKIRKGSNRK